MLRELDLNEMEMVSGGTDTSAPTIHGMGVGAADEASHFTSPFGTPLNSVGQPIWSGGSNFGGAPIATPEDDTTEEDTSSNDEDDESNFNPTLVVLGINPYARAAILGARIANALNSLPPLRLP